jgi:hypothetical protein
VTSAARRELLRILWRDGAIGTVSELARLSGVAFASAYRELNAMKQVGLVSVERSAGASEIFRANRASPVAAAIETLVGHATRRGAAGVAARKEAPPEDDELRRRLRTLGAPLLVDAAPARGAPPPELVIAEGARLARRDATLARALPVVIWRQREHLDWDRLRHEGRRVGEKHALGFFVELTGELGGDARLADEAAPLRDRRVRQLHDFFVGQKSAYERRLAELHTPAAARRWGFRMNQELESFVSTFQKAEDASLLAS